MIRDNCCILLKKGEVGRKEKSLITVDYQGFALFCILFS